MKNNYLIVYRLSEQVKEKAPVNQFVSLIV